MENHVRVILIDEWVCYFPVESYETLKQTMINKEILELNNLFDMPIIIRGESILYIFMSTTEGRLLHDKFDKIMRTEEKEYEKKYKEANPEWLEE